MRLSTLILITTIMQVSAVSRAQMVTLSEKNTPLVAVFNKIRNQTGYDFVITREVLKHAKPVTITTKNEALSKVLPRILKGQNLNFSIEDKIVVVSAREKTIADKVVDFFLDYTLRGLVLNERGEPLAGANVSVMGRSSSYGTTDNGRFRLDNLNGSELLITTYLGYKTDTLQLQGEENVVIRLRPVTSNLSEVNIVNTGYQRLNKSRVSGAYGKPDMEVFVNRVGTTDVLSRLDGLVAGLAVVAGPEGSSGNIYQTGSNQRSVLRGISSISLNTQPLYVVDGVQIPNLSNLNPNDIADVTVLKDAAAATIYGVQASNGVIVITTKSGKKDGKIQISYNGYFTLTGRPRFKEGFYLNSEQYIKAAVETFDPLTNPYSSVSYYALAPHEEILYNRERNLISAAQATQSLDSLSNIDNRKQINDLFYRNGYTTNHSVSASAGNQIYSIYSSASYTSSRSTTPGQYNNNYLINLSQNINPAKWLSIGLNTSLNYMRAKNKEPLTVGPAFLPYQLFADEHGAPMQMNYMNGLSPERKADFQERSRVNLDYVPLGEMDKGYGKRNLFSTNTTANVQVKFWKGLSYQGTYGYRKSSGTIEDYLDHTSMNMRNELIRFTIAATPQDIPRYLLPAEGGKFVSRYTNSQNWTVRNQLVFNTGLRGGKDRMNIQIGQEALENSDHLEKTILRGYDDVLKTYALLDYATLRKPIYGAVGSGYSSLYELPFELLEEKRRFTSFFGLFNYAFNDKYMLDASIRKDKSSLFASDNSSQNKPVYSIGAKWMLSRENFMQHLSWLSNLGMRATYGISGNSPRVGTGTIYDVLGVGQDPILGNSLTISTVANGKLSWESTKTLNIGLDFGILNRLNGNVDLYFKSTADLLGDVKFNPFTGILNSTGNIGNIKNRGIELTLNSSNIKTRNFDWTSTWVFSYNYNKLISYSEPSPYALGADSRSNAVYLEGYPMPTIFAYRFAGLDDMGDPQIFKADGTITKDRNAAVAEDLVFMGTTQPKYNGGLSNVFRYQSFSLSANIIYNLGAVMRKPTEMLYDRLTASSFADGNVKASFADRWKVPGDEARTIIPSYVSNPGINYERRNLNYYISGDINVLSADYIKLRDVTLSYNLPGGLLRRLQVQNASLFVQTGNFLLWKANKEGIDPEYGAGRLTDRNYSFGLNVSF